MEIILGLDQLNRAFVNPVVTLGNFDGIHLGHQEIFRRVKEEALRIQGESVVITFDPHPLKILSPRTCLPLLTPFRKKMILIEQAGIDVVLCIRFSQDFSKISAYDFIKDILLDRLNVRKVIVGYNYRFGRGHEGDVQSLTRISRGFGIDVEVVEPLKLGQTVVSSSRIRRLLEDGDVEEAARLLGRDYRVIGNVVEGSKRGRTLGFPTANLAISEDAYPRAGVYAVEVLWDQARFPGVANIGFNPTFRSPEMLQKRRTSLEVFILDFDREIYGEEIQVIFKKRIRDEIQFQSSSQLVQKIKEDVEWAKKNVFGNRPRE